jgi:hypothetical protein
VNKEQPTYPKSPKVQNAIKAPYYANFTTHLLKRRGRRLPAGKLAVASGRKRKIKKAKNKSGGQGRLCRPSENLQKQKNKKPAGERQRASEAQADPTK